MPITDYISADKPDRALSFVAELEANAAKVAQRPKSFPTREDIAPGIRSTIHRNYLIFFRELDDEVRIVHVVHMRRDLRRPTFD